MRSFVLLYCHAILSLIISQKLIRIHKLNKAEEVETDALKAAVTACE